jgi:hypothetical protein
MRTRRFWFCAVAVIVLALGWYWFRPELLFVDRLVSEAFPRKSTSATPSRGEATASENSVVLAKGKFHSVAHETSGTATIHRLADGGRVLRLTDFATSNGPDVRVILIAANDADDGANVTESGYIELGKLKGNKGDQNYELPDDVDLDRYQAVTIWCYRFSVNFGTAPLRTAAL